MESVSLKDVKVGDTLVRMLGGTVPMTLAVTNVGDDYVHCGPYMFERATGAEYDPDLGWGSEFGATGSFIAEIRAA